MLQVKNLSFSYHRGRKDALCDFNLTLEAGRVYGLLGKNGVGKSTLLSLMSGLLTPRKGEVLYRGVDVRRRLPVTLQDMFLVPEEFDLPAIPLLDYVSLNAPFYPRFNRDELFKYLQLFDLDIWVDNLASLSMGQKKKFFMCFALATNVSLLLMDEPTNGLDIPGKSQFRKLIACGMSDERTILISTHQVRDVEHVLDHVLIMDNTRICLDASMFELSKRMLFLESDDRELASRALYALPTIQGNLLLLPNNEDGVESVVNLELLFGAMLERPEEISALFYPENKK